ncbi:MAG TPA: PilZ domain-containing protein [Nitrospira sp.]|nr:PilZ domain-containing protein [Nitrospira sp.]
MRLRYCTRVATNLPVIFAHDSFVGEGTVLNVSVPGCAVVSKKVPQSGSYLEMKLLLPGPSPSLSVGLARVRWSQGQHFGVEFIRMPGDDQIRLGRLLRRQLSDIPLRRIQAR